jgi:hypothetical protein
MAGRDDLVLQASRQACTASAGEATRPGDPGYEAARQIWNALVEKHPGALLKCRCTFDVVSAESFAMDSTGVGSIRGT